MGCSLALLVATSAVHIFKPNNVVFGEIGTRLHLNEKGRKSSPDLKAGVSRRSECRWIGFR